jgi:hypothetical protein
MSNFMKIRPLGAELFHSNRRTYTEIVKTKVKVAVCNFANAAMSDLGY